ncbi:MAG TPA: hypothetical protein VEB22_11410 [Phycisphaerales bacterium]|nr:hypothetical protein [Phycisphaerales bacterium]
MQAQPLCRSARSSAAVIAVVALLAVAGVAVYAVVSIARETPAEEGARKGATGPTASETLLRVDPLITEGKGSEAVAVLLPAIEAYPQDQELRLALARAYSLQKEWLKSSAAYEAALLLGKETAALHAEAGTVANAAGKVELAIERYGRAQDLDPKNPIHPLYLGMVQIKAGKEREAMTSLLTATVLNPELAAAWGSMGELELRANHLDLALQHLAKARAIEPESFKWRLAEAKTHKRRNEPGKALDLLVNLPNDKRYSKEAVQVIADSLAMMKQVEGRAEFLRLAKAHAEGNGDAATVELITTVLAPATGG